MNKHEEFTFKSPQETIESIKKTINFTKRLRHACFEYSLDPVEEKKIAEIVPKQDWEQKEQEIHSLLDEKDASINLSKLIEALTLLATDYTIHLRGFISFSNLLAKQIASLLKSLDTQSDLSTSSSHAKIIYSSNLSHMHKFKLLILLQNNGLSIEDSIMKKSMSILFQIKIDQLEDSSLSKLLTLSILLAYNNYLFYSTTDNHTNYKKIYTQLLKIIKQIKIRCEQLNLTIPKALLENFWHLQIISEKNIQDSMVVKEEKLTPESKDTESIQKFFFDNLQKLIHIINQAPVPGNSLVNDFPQLIDLTMDLYLKIKLHNDINAKTILQLLLSFYAGTYPANDNCLKIFYYAYHHATPKTHSREFLLQAAALLERMQDIELSDEIRMLAFEIYHTLSMLYSYEGQLTQTNDYLIKSFKYTKETDYLLLAQYYIQNCQMAYQLFLQTLELSHLNSILQFFDLFNGICHNLEESADKEIMRKQIGIYKKDSIFLKNIFNKQLLNSNRISSESKTTNNPDNPHLSPTNSASSSIISNEIKLETPKINNIAELKSAITLYLQNQNRLFSLSAWKSYVNDKNFNFKDIISRATTHYDNHDYIFSEFWYSLLLLKICTQKEDFIHVITKVLFQLSENFSSENNKSIINRKQDKRYLWECILGAFNLIEDPQLEIKIIKIEVLKNLSISYEYENWEMVKHYILKIPNAIEKLEVRHQIVDEHMHHVHCLATKWYEMTRIDDFKKIGQWAIPLQMKIMEIMQPHGRPILPQNIVTSAPIKSTNHGDSLTEEMKTPTNLKKKKKKKKIPDNSTNSANHSDSEQKINEIISQEAKETINPLESASILKNLSAEKEVLKQKCHALSLEITNIKQEKGRQEEKLNQTLKENKNSNEQLKTLKNEKSNLLSKISKLEEQLNQFQEQKQEEQTQQDTTIQDLQESIKQYKEDLEEYQKKIKQLTEQESENLETIENFNTENDQLKSTIVKFQDREKLLIREKNQLTEKIKQLETKSQNKNQSKEINTLKQNKQELTSELAETKQQLQKRQKEVETLEEQLNVRKTTLTITLEQNATLDTQLQKSYQENDRLKEELAQAYKEIAEKEQSIEKYKQNEQQASQIINEHKYAPHNTPIFYTSNQMLSGNYSYPPNWTIPLDPNYLGYSNLNLYNSLPMIPLPPGCKLVSFPMQQTPSMQQTPTKPSNHRSTQQGYPRFRYTDAPNTFQASTSLTSPPEHVSYQYKKNSS